MGIIIALVIVLIIIVVAVSSVQQHKEKQEKEKRVKSAKQKAIIDESEELILNMANLPSNPNIINILNRRSLNAAKMMKSIHPESKAINKKLDEIGARLKASEDLSANQSGNEEQFN